MINCLREVQEQVPASYKLPKIQQEMRRELYLADIRRKISKEPSLRFVGKGEFLFKEQEEHGSQSLSRIGRRQSRR